MEAKEVDVSFPRGDYFVYKFKLFDANKNPLEIDNQTELYFTVKKNYNTTNYLLQKRYSTSGIEVDGNVAVVVFNHTDTASMRYGRYVYDIQLKSGEYVKTLVIGEFELTNEATHLANE